MKRLITFLALAVSVSITLADDTASRQKLTLDGAKKVGEAAMKYAGQNNCSLPLPWWMKAVICCISSGQRKASAAGANVSIGKARTSAIFKKPTKDFEDTINKGRFTMTALPDFTPLQGGVPIVVGGQVVGAIGCSGAKSAAQDEEVALAGAAVLSDAKSVQ